MARVILLGYDSGMPRELSQDFRETGMTHVIAISRYIRAMIINRDRWLSCY
ncbi:MAG: ComEC/Rec2 family competence protein [Candidatus Promineofilum sp.]|nr:ComEC/Rec2 family competence protein [Promineifilum sp.]